MEETTIRSIGSGSSPPMTRRGAEEKAGGSERAEDTTHDTQRCQPAGLAQNEPINQRALCAQGHAQRNLPRALADSVGDDAVEPNRTQQGRAS
jgi:hypothetical protein